MKLDDILSLDRKNEIPSQGPVCDLLWSDPADCDGFGVSSRGAGFIFGKDITKEFNHTNKINKIYRAH